MQAAGASIVFEEYDRPEPLPDESELEDIAQQLADLRVIRNKMDINRFIDHPSEEVINGALNQEQIMEHIVAVYSPEGDEDDDEEREELPQLPKISHREAMEMAERLSIYAAANQGESQVLFQVESLAKRIVRRCVEEVGGYEP